MDKNLLSIAIVNYNNRNELGKCLQSIYQTKGAMETEIFVFDNNSSDGSPQMVESLFPQINLTKNPENIGLTRALNFILKKVSGNYILFLDSDTQLKDGALQGLLSFLSRNRQAGIAGARIYNAEGSIQETVRRFPGFNSGLFGRRSLITRLFPDNPISRKLMCMESLNAYEPFEVDYVSAACMMMKREVFDKIGFMDKVFFVYWCDVDWCRRARNSGFKVFCIPSAKVIHYEMNQPWRKKSSKMIIDFHKGAYNYYRKHHIKNPVSVKNTFAISALLLRAVFHLCLNQFKQKERRSNESTISIS
ncbi:MAG: glycosyltransferase family 2 protein [Planctomycetota bacterium]|jgi:GT2 family glycosyltransferase